jgi:hypothetical protein
MEHSSRGPVNKDNPFEWLHRSPINPETIMTPRELHDCFVVEGAVPAAHEILGRPRSGTLGYTPQPPPCARVRIES